MTKIPSWPSPDFIDLVEFIHIQALVRAVGAEQIVQALGPEDVANLLNLLAPPPLRHAPTAEQATGRVPVQLLDAALSKLTPEQRLQLGQRLLNPTAGTGS